MADTLVEQMFENRNQSEQGRIVKTLEMLTIVDTGTVLGINAAGRATVASNKAVGGQQVIYHDIEVIGIGNPRGGFMVDGTGATCLIFVPRSSVPNVGDQKIAWDALPFDSRGAKALPITNCTQLTTTALFDSSGDFHLFTENYAFDFSPKLVKYSQDGLVAYVDNTTKLYMRRKMSESGEIVYVVDDVGIQKTYTASDKKLQCTQTITDTSVDFAVGTGTPTQDAETGELTFPKNFRLSLANGTCTLSQVDDQDTSLFSIAIDDTGALTISAAKDISISSDKDVNVSCANANVTATTKVTLSGANGVVEIT